MPSTYALPINSGEVLGPTVFPMHHGQFGPIIYLPTNHQQQYVNHGGHNPSHPQECDNINTNVVASVVDSATVIVKNDKSINNKGLSDGTFCEARVTHRNKSIVEPHMESMQPMQSLGTVPDANIINRYYNNVGLAAHHKYDSSWFNDTPISSLPNVDYSGAWQAGLSNNRIVRKTCLDTTVPSDMLIDMDDGVIGNSNSRISRRLHICSFDGCGYQSSRWTNLKTHMLKHTGDKPYNCRFEGCLYKTAHLGNMKSHENVHLGVKPFKCNVPGCLHSATQRSNLKAHKRRV